MFHCALCNYPFTPQKQVNYKHVRMKDILSEAHFLRILLCLFDFDGDETTFFYSAHALVFECSAIYQSMWANPRTKFFGLWNENVLNYWINEYRLQNLRLNKETFTYICEEIRVNRNFRKAVSAEIRVAIVLCFHSFACDCYMQLVKPLLRNYYRKSCVFQMK